MKAQKKRLSKRCIMMMIVFTISFFLTGFFSLGMAAEAKKHDEFKIHIHGAVQGSSGQIITFAWADLINKNSDWLKVTVSEEAAPGAAVPLLVRMPQKRKNTAMFVIEAQLQGWSLGLPPLTPKTAYKSWTIIAQTINVPFGILTFDPELKTLKDLEGQKFCNLGRRSPASKLMDNILETAGLKDKVKIDYLDPFSGKDALLSGLVKSVLLPLSNDAPNWGKFPYVTEIMASRETYYTDLTKEAIEKEYTRDRWPQFPIIHVPAGVYGPSQKAFWTFMSGNYYTVDREMPEDVVYEMLRVMYENIDKFTTYHIMAKSMSREKMGMIPMTEEHKHPGAIKFYKEKGIKYGVPMK